MVTANSGHNLAFGFLAALLAVNQIMYFSWTQCFLSQLSTLSTCFLGKSKMNQIWFLFSKSFKDLCQCLQMWAAMVKLKKLLIPNLLTRIKLEGKKITSRVSESEFKLNDSKVPFNCKIQLFCKYYQKSSALKRRKELGSFAKKKKKKKDDLRQSFN